jgi:hypothetical protein
MFVGMQETIHETVVARLYAGSIEMAVPVETAKRGKFCVFKTSVRIDK